MERKGLVNFYCLIFFEGNLIKEVIIKEEKSLKFRFLLFFSFYNDDPSKKINK